MSARRDIAYRSLDFECATVTVALSAMRSWASGVPTMVERPISQRLEAGERPVQADRDAADIEG
jgi:hypothetical protein